MICIKGNHILGGTTCSMRLSRSTVPFRRYLEVIRWWGRTRYHSDDVSAGEYRVDFLIVVKFSFAGYFINVTYIEIIPLHIKLLPHSRDICVRNVGSVQVWNFPMRGLEIQGSTTLAWITRHLQFVKYCEGKTKISHWTTRKTIGQTIRQQYDRINQSILRRSTFSSLDEGTSPQMKMRAFRKVREIISYERLYQDRDEVKFVLFPRIQLGKGNLATRCCRRRLVRPQSTFSFHVDW